MKSTSTPGNRIRAAKIVVAGGFGAGKTTLIGAVSDVIPLQTEAVSTQAAAGIDDPSLVPNKTSTTVAMDFGRITIDDTLVLYLFGTPGQQRFWFMWDEITRGAIGAVVLADPRRLTDSFPVIDYLDDRGLPYVIAVNPFPDVDIDLADIRVALQVNDDVPVVTCDARQRPQVRDTLIHLVDHATARYRAARSAGHPIAS